MSNQPIFAEDEVLRRFKGRTKLFLKFSHRFFGNIPQLKEDIERFRALEDPDEIRTWAHSMAGVVGNLGGKRLFDAAKALEFAAEETEKTATIAARLEDLDRELRVFESELGIRSEQMEQKKRAEESE